MAPTELNTADLPSGADMDAAIGAGGADDRGAQ